MVISPVSCKEPSRMLFITPTTGLTSLREHDLMLRVKTSYHPPQSGICPTLPLKAWAKRPSFAQETRELSENAGSELTQASSRMEGSIYPWRWQQGRALSTSGYCSCLYFPFSFPTTTPKNRALGIASIKTCNCSLRTTAFFRIGL